MSTIKRKVMSPLDITKLSRCPYCNSTDIDYDLDDSKWECNYCGEVWKEAFE